MLLTGGVLLLAGLVIGGILAWILAGSRGSAANGDLQARLAQTTAEIAEKNRQLEAARERETIQRESLAAASATAEAQTAQIAELRAESEKAHAENERLRQAGHAAQVAAAEMRTALDSERTKADEKIAVLTAAREELSNQFKALANEILEQKSKTFTEQNRENLTTLLSPLREKFGEFQLKVESLEKDGITGRTELKAQIDNLRTLNERLSADAANLVTALKGSSKTQGDWGELVLEKLLESAGLRRNVEYRVQRTMGRDEGGNARLDVILDLPEDRHLVIDSKVSLNAYTEYCNTEDEELRKLLLKQHLSSVRNHLKELSARAYQDLYGLQSLDFVLMFLPVEPAFMLAIANDARLWQDAYDKNVLLVSPSSLLCVVRTVAQIWRQERQSRNVEEIAKRGRILYDKFRGFTEDLIRVGAKLGDAREAYDSAFNKLTRADGNLVSQAEKLVKLGIKPNKTLPQPLIDQAMSVDEVLEMAAVSDDSTTFGQE
jgi:DNA recombination protein RmuC